VAELKLVCNAVFAEAAALVVATIPRLFTVAEMLADPMPRNTIMGTYTYFANPLGLSAIAVPGAMRDDGLPSSLCFVGRPWADLELLKTANAFAPVL
jgi:allophanate hydrolase